MAWPARHPQDDDRSLAAGGRSGLGFVLEQAGQRKSGAAHDADLQEPASIDRLPPGKLSTAVPQSA
jgi:hypothetical protein